MQMRWRMLAVLFAARLAMAFQFQAVAALSPSYQATYGVGLDSIGFLIGLYVSPGLFLALPSGLIGAALGGKRGVGLGLALMVAGALGAVFAVTWEHEMAARLVAGTGGVLLNVLMTKMVTDWFAKADLATAMGLFVNSWPVGIAAALLVLPALGGPASALFLVVLCTAALGVFLALYRDPPDMVVVPSGPLMSMPDEPRVLVGILSAGLIWGCMNAGLAVAFSFGTALLSEQGFTLEAGAARTSLILWCMALTIPIGGIIADRTGRHDLVIFVSLAGFGALMALIPYAGGSVVLFGLLGAVGGLSAGPIMSLPAGVLPANWRAQGMGVFFTVYYLVITISPPIAGWAAEITGSASAAFWVGVAFVAVCPPLQLVLRRCRV